MNKYNNVFLDILPSLDLHGYASDMVFVLLDEFLTDNIKLKRKKVLVVHGKGEGIIKNTVHDILKKDKRVYSYYLDSFNTGCTIVELY